MREGVAEHVRIEAVTAAALDRYASISPAFLVDSVLRVEAVDGGLGGVLLREERVESPYVKDNDAYDGSPSEWPARFDLGRRGIFLALEASEPVGGSAVALTTPEVAPLAWPGSATLCDIRVRSDRRGEGVGGLLLDAAAGWARGHGARSLLIETQNVNVRACRFYASRGCELAAVDRFAYASTPELAHEVMLVWRLAL